MNIVLDTNILIDLVNGREAAKNLLQQQGYHTHISAISWVEVMVGARTPQEKERLRTFLQLFAIIETNPTIAEIAVELRQQYRLRLPDAMIWATAKHLSATLVTRDADYPKDALDIRIPYRV